LWLVGAALLVLLGCAKASIRRGDASLECGSQGAIDREGATR
jgi:hypothetical protein